MSYVPHHHRAAAGDAGEVGPRQLRQGRPDGAEPGHDGLVQAGGRDGPRHLPNDLAFTVDPTVPKNPHNYMALIQSMNELVRRIAHGLRAQM